MSIGTANRIRKAVVPAAGQGTRLYPLTKVQPKEMMPVGPYPAIDWVIQELAAAEITEILVITGPGKSAIEAHLDPQEGRLARADLPLWLTEFDSSRITIYFTRQNPPGGLGEAVACARQFVGDEDFVVALGDSVIISEQAAFTRRLLDAHQTSPAVATLGVQPIPPEKASSYGVIEVAEEAEGRLVISNVVEKPEPDQAPSKLAICGRYVFSPEIFAKLNDLQAGRGRELQLTDAIAALATSDRLVQAIPLAPEELRLDVGNLVSYSQAFVRGMLSHPAIAPSFREYLLRLAVHLQDSSQPDPDRTTTDPA